MAPLLAVAVPAHLAVAQGGNAAIRDSAGTHIVENIAPLWTARNARHLEAVPALTLGIGASKDDEFGNVQAAVRLTDGRIIVADRKNLELKEFSATGAFIRRIGQKGDGPGDFAGLWAVFRLPGDTILTWDGRQHRLTWFAVDGKAKRTLAVAQPPMVTYPGGQRMGAQINVLGPLLDGSFLGSHGNGRMNPPTALFVDTMYLSHVSTDGKLLPLATVLSGQSYSYSSSTGYSTGDIRPFTANASAASGSRTLWYTDGAHFEIREYDLRGTVQRAIRVRRTLAPVTSQDIAAFKARELEELSHEKFRDEKSRSEITALTNDVHRWMVFPKLMPAWSALKVEPGGASWARQYGDTAKVQHWDAFDSNGRYLGVVDTPPGVEVLEFGAEYMLGRYRDEDGVESVRLYRFVH